MNNNILKIIFTAAMLTVIIAGHPVAAANLTNAFGNDLQRVAEGAGYDPQQKSLEAIAGTVISAFLSILGIVFLGFIVYGGYTWMTARGDSAKIDMAKGVIRTSIIGLVIILSAYAISYFVLSQIGSETLSNPGE